MNWYCLLKLAEKALYHGTIVDHADSIGNIGLVPGVGDFIRDAYGSDYEAAGIDIDEHFTDLSFAADKENINAAHTAMIHHIAKKLNKHFHDVTDQDIRVHGMIVKIVGSPGPADPPSPFEQRPEDYNQNWEMMAQERGLHSVEPGDYYSEDGTGGTQNGHIQIIRGSALIRFLSRFGLINKHKKHEQLSMF